MSRDRLIQLALLAVAGAALTGAALLGEPIKAERQRLRLTIAAADTPLAKHPKTALLQAIPGGLRAPFLVYLSIRSQQLKDQGNFFDAKGLRDLICDLMPHFPGVWLFHGWDMAWNISVAAHTPEERWMWVHNGIRLLRDRGLYYNPDDMILHKELSWIFFSKMGERTDEMHWYYKLRWLEEMEFVLALPPISEQAGSRAEAFRSIAEAPEQVEGLSAEAQAFAARLAELDVAADEAFLRNYNSFGDDPLLPARYARRPDGPTQKVIAEQKLIAELMSAPAHAAGRAELLAFVRAKVLREQYRMDPKWMLRLMERFGPLDWRHVMSHAIYWATMGLHRGIGLDLSEISPAMAEARLPQLIEEGDKLREIHALNTERNVLNALKALSLTGQIGYDPTFQHRHQLIFGPDWRFFEPAHREYTSASQRIMESARPVAGERNALRDAHINFLTNAILVLYLAGKESDAQRYYDILKDELLVSPRDEIYEKALHDFVVTKRAENAGATTSMYLAFRHGALVRAYRALAQGDTDEFARSHAFAQQAYKVFIEGFGKAPRLGSVVRSFAQEEAFFLRNLLLDPRSVGMQMSLMGKSGLYRRLPLATRQLLYPAVRKRLRDECRREGLDFDKAFPAPPLQQTPRRPR